MTNKILALKYRPQEFKDLIGQQVMVKTITNAIKLGKTPNAYLLTGIRGVGKTTTARLIAKALNCTKNFSKGEQCKSNENADACFLKKSIKAKSIKSKVSQSRVNQKVKVKSKVKANENQRTTGTRKSK